MIDIDAITDQFELIIVKRGEDWDHKVRTVVVDANGQIQTIIYGNEWKPPRWSGNRQSGKGRAGPAAKE